MTKKKYGHPDDLDGERIAISWYDWPRDTSHVYLIGDGEVLLGDANARTARVFDSGGKFHDEMRIHANRVYVEVTAMENWQLDMKVRGVHNEIPNERVEWLDDVNVDLYLDDTLIIEAHVAVNEVMDKLTFSADYEVLRA